MPVLEEAHMTTHGITRGSAGPRIALGAALAEAGVLLEWVLDPQRSDGTVARPVTFALIVGISAVGWAMSASALRAVRGDLPSTRAVRFGRATSVLGAVLALLGTLAVLAGGLVQGRPWGVAFVPWAVGVLLLSVGAAVLGIALIRASTRVGASALLAGVAAFAALAIPLDPWHDVALAAMAAGWIGVGLSLPRGDAQLSVDRGGSRGVGRPVSR